MGEGVGGWGAAKSEIEVPSAENTELKGSPFKTWSRLVYSHTCYAYFQGFLPCLFLLSCTFTCIFFPNLFHFFPCVGCHHHHQSLNREGRWGTTDDFATSFLHFSLFSTVLWDLPNSRPVHSRMLSSHLFLCPPCLLPPFTVPCKMVLALFS